MKKRILILINPISGTGKQTRAIKIMNQCIDYQKFDTEIAYSQYKGHMSVLAQNAAENNYDAVVVVGGDGSINEAAQGLIGTETALGIIPIGSGNGLARHLKIPLQIKSAIERINAFKTDQIDTASINNHQFVSIAGIGFDAHIAKQFDISGKRGLWNYTRISVREFFRFSSQKYYLSIDEKDYEEEAFMVVFANANQFGNNFVISPQGKINDGLLDICIVQKPKIYQVPDLFLKLFLKRMHHSDLIKIVRAKKINVRLKHSNLINLDGESVVVDGDLTLSINPLSLHIIC